MKSKRLLLMASLACLALMCWTPLASWSAEPDPADELYLMKDNIQTRWSSFENQDMEKGKGGMENAGGKGHAFEFFHPGETKVLLDAKGSGTVRRMWVTLSERDPKFLRSVRIDMYWDGAEKPAVSAPFGDFMGAVLGRLVRLENALFTSPEGRSFVCTIPMPFRKGARITLTNESPDRTSMLFYDVNVTLGDEHGDDDLYFHAYWRRTRWTKLGEDFEILPRVEGRGRFLGCHIGVIENPKYTGWFGEGEAKVYLDGDEKWPTLVGTGTEDYIGTGWGQGVFQTKYMGSLYSKNRERTFYRYHIPDPIYFHKDCRVTIHQMGGTSLGAVRKMLENGAELEPLSVGQGEDRYYLKDQPDINLLEDDRFEDSWFVTFYRRDDVSAVAYFYLDSPVSNLPELPGREDRVEAIGTE